MRLVSLIEVVEDRLAADNPVPFYFTTTARIKRMQEQTAADEPVLLKGRLWSGPLLRERCALWERTAI